MSVAEETFGGDPLTFWRTRATEDHHRGEGATEIKLETVPFPTALADDEAAIK